MSNSNSKSKVTYSYDQRMVLLLKESFLRDLKLFQTLLSETPKNWTITVIQDGSEKELVVNLPQKSK